MDLKEKYMNPAYKKILKKYTRTIVVGDIHGCYKELVKLLTAVQFSDQDLLISVGDLVDRGPASLDVLKFFHNTENAYTVAGNHERSLSRTIRGKIEQPKWPQLHTLSIIPCDDRLLWAGFLEQLPSVIESDHAQVTHARLNPQLPIDNQDAYFTSAVGGMGVTIEVDEQGVPLWFRNWKKGTALNKPVCIGHLEYDRVELLPRELFALDTIAVRGGLLTAIVLPDHEIVQIKAEKNYYEYSKLEWSKLDLLKDRPENLPLSKYFLIKEKEVKNIYEEEMITNIEIYLKKIGIPEIVSRLKNRFIEKFGTIPEDNREKGRYFIFIRNEFPFINHRVVNLILSSKSFSLEVFLRLFRTDNLKKALESLDEIDRELRSRVILDM